PASAITGPAVDSGYVWLLNDGTILDFETGTQSWVPFCNINPTPADDYYILVRHRNHLPVMSANVVHIDSTTGNLLVDFTNIANVYDSGELPLSTPGEYGMFPCSVVDDPVNGDVGEVNASDLFRVGNINATISDTYDKRDVDMDGDVDGSDYNLTNTANDNLYYTTVPNP
ncbi:MAG: hypothetical protein NZ108_02930, partial [Bacteroidia bacterium]|nr:hypothetical protein [Bacteroidia bacterium]